MQTLPIKIDNHFEVGRGMRKLNEEHLDTADRKYSYHFDELMRTYIIRTLESHFSGETALEMGCFEGGFSRVLRENFGDLTVLEGAGDLIEIAKRNCKDLDIKFVQGYFENTEFAKKFDNIFLIHTLEHVEAPVPVLKKVRSWLNPDARFFVICPNANAASRQIAVGMGLISSNASVTSGEFDHGHRRTYSLDTLEADAVQAGFTVEARGGIFFKANANFQIDQMLKNGIIDMNYMEGCFKLGQKYPDLCASIYLVCRQ